MKLSSRVRYPFLALAIAIGVGSIGLQVTRQASDAQALPLPEDLVVDFSEIEDPTVGSENAPVSIIEYASFTCSHCANFSKDTFPRLKEDFIDTGEVQFSVREIFTHKAGLWASQIARCGTKEKYFPVAKDIFLTFDQWTKADSDDEMLRMLSMIGEGHGLTKEEVDACVADEDMAKALVLRSSGLAEADSVRGTPTLIINGELVRNQPYEKLKPIIEEAVRSASRGDL